MASVSVPATCSPFDHPFHMTTPSISSHNRRKSRDPTAAPLPSFTFNPGAPVHNSEVENQEPEPDTMKGHTRRISKPPPLPEFKFNPGADLQKEERPSPTHPVLEEMAMNQQRVVRSARPAPLPAFTFGPGISAHTSPSPTRSEFADQSKLGGHKRAGSEFVGGGGVEGPTMVNTSPAKHESKASGPPISGAGRRGHAHRRSQAVSISDIDTSDLIKTHAVAKARSGSQPSTPSEIPPNFLGHQSPSGRSISAISPPSSPRRRESASANRPRVEFAERVDVIPRPLSMISSETESSISTVRYGHSLNNSINSIASPSIASPIRIPSTLSSPVLEEEYFPPRPKTADPATLLFPRNTSPERLLSVANLPKRPLSASNSPAMANTENHPVKKKHFWFNHSPDRTPTPSPAVEQPDPFSTIPTLAQMSSTTMPRPKTSPERSTSIIKRKKYRTWTNGIFPKRNQNRVPKIKVKRSPTPPTLHRRASDQLNEIFDADDTVVIRTGSPETKRTQHKIEIPPPIPSFIRSPTDVTTPILDLDAALGPFGSEVSLGGENTPRSAGSRISKLHSAERRGVTDAFGGVHRRAESAPSMPSFNRSSYTQHRHGSNTSLTAEVFDEEEEDNFLAGEQKADDIESSDAGEDSETKPTLDNHDKLVDGLGLSNVSETSDAVLIIDAEENIAPDDIGSSKSTIEQPMFVEPDFAKRPMSSPMSFAYPSTQSHYASSTEGRTTTSASMISSPDPDHIQFDHVPRLGHGFGEPAADVYLRPSTDDLPSLSDSVSSNALPRLSGIDNLRWSDEHRDQRSASMFVPGTSRSTQNWKRTSLATLNRLIPGSANGSKLKFETVPDVVIPDDKSEKKIRRLSKLLTFWRSRDRMED